MSDHYTFGMRVDGMLSASGQFIREPWRHRFARLLAESLREHGALSARSRFVVTDIDRERGIVTVQSTVNRARPAVHARPK